MNKFFPNEVAFRLHRNKVQHVIIEEVNIKLTASSRILGQYSTEISYEFREPGVDLEEYRDGWLTADQSELFATKEELLASL